MKNKNNVYIFLGRAAGAFTQVSLKQRVQVSLRDYPLLFPIPLGLLIIDF